MCIRLKQRHCLLHYFQLPVQPTTFGIVKYHFIKGQRGSVKLVYADYSFVKYITNTKGTKWICATRSSTKCRARIRISQDKQLEVLHAQHNHGLCKRATRKKTRIN